MSGIEEHFPALPWPRGSRPKREVLSWRALSELISGPETQELQELSSGHPEFMDILPGVVLVSRSPHASSSLNVILHLVPEYSPI